MAEALQGTERSANMLQRVRYTHDAMIDLILQRPEMSQNELALYFGYSVPWVSSIMNSDAFQNRLAQRKTELVDPKIVMELNERLNVLAHQSLDKVQKAIQIGNGDFALKTLELTTKALGFGARADKNHTVNATFVVALPGKAESAEIWAQNARSPVIDVQVKEVQNG